MTLSTLLIFGVCADSVRSETAGQTKAAPASQPHLPAPPLSRERWLPGLDYIALIPEQPTTVAPGKVQVLVWFLYTSPVSRNFETAVKKWLPTKPEYIEYVAKPGIRFPHARLQARLY